MLSLCKSRNAKCKTPSLGTAFCWAQDKQIPELGRSLLLAPDPIQQQHDYRIRQQ